MGLHSAPESAHHGGQEAGIEAHTLDVAASEPAVVTCVDYTPERYESQRVENLAEFLKLHRPEWAVKGVRWIHVEGLQDLGAIKVVAEKYGLHPLAIEDLLHVPQRPKVEPFAGARRCAGRGMLFVAVAGCADGGGGERGGRGASGGAAGGDVFGASHAADVSREAG